MTKYSVVVPVFNAEGTLKELAARLDKALASTGKDYEMLFVDDGSRDGSWAVLSALRRENRKVRIIQLAKNFGKDYALICGMRSSRGEILVCMDDDLQDRPEDVPLLVRSLEEDAETDVVIAKPGTKNHSVVRDMLSAAMNRAANLVVYKTPGIATSSFLAMRRAIFESILSCQSKNIIFIASVFSVTGRVKNVEVVREKRKQGRSGFTLRMQLALAMDILTAQSNLPLAAVSVVGFVCGTASVLLLIYYFLFYYLHGNTVTGWMTLVVINLFFAAITLLSFGVIGQYLTRITKELNYAPRYVIRKSEGFDEP